MCLCGLIKRQERLESTHGRAVKSSIYSSLPPKLGNTCTHTNTEINTMPATSTLHPLPTLLHTRCLRWNLLWAVILMDPLLQSVSQQSTSLWQWPKFLLSEHICMHTLFCCVYVISSCVYHVKNVGVCVHSLSRYNPFNLSLMYCRLFDSETTRIKSLKSNALAKMHQKDCGHVKFTHS